MTEEVIPIAPRRSLITWLLMLLIVVVVLLGLVNVGLAGVKAIEQPVSGTTGSLLYATTFDNYANEWSQFDGQMSSKISDGMLHIAINAANDGAYSVLNYNFADFDIRLNAKRVNSGDPYDEIGLLFRYSDPANYYIFKIRGDGFYRVERRKDNQTEVLSEWHAAPVILQGLMGTNRLRVIGQGDTFKFYINDQPLILCPNGPAKQKSTWSEEKCLSNNGQTSTLIQDAAFRMGKIGVGVRVDVAGTEVAFDNVVITAP
jgi:hypothetical protein